VIPFDLDYIAQSANYNAVTCDLWEEIQSTDLFWNKYTTRKALLLGAQFATHMGDTNRSTTYTNAVKDLENILNAHWNNS